ncbi:MAG TPA: Crp/Fnr family transcriptional regulator [Planctomycetota bacterium]|nr:Crp/Fnr family transcriptional regulator [Planctomycetota bacterium]
MVELERERVREFLEDTLFAGVGPEALDRLASIARTKEVPRGTHLFSMGQSCETLWFVVDGCGELTRTSPDGRVRILHRAGPGEMVGAVPFFDGKGYPATFVAGSDTIVLGLERERLLALLRAEPAIALAIIGGVIARLRMMVGLVEQASFEDTSHRLFHELLKRSVALQTGEFPRVVDPLPTRQHLADAIGSVREVVSRRLSRLVEDGHVRIDGRKAVLLKPLEPSGA